MCVCVCVCVSQDHTGHGVEPRRVARDLVTATVVLGLGCGSGAEYGQGDKSVRERLVFAVVAKTDPFSVDCMYTLPRQSVRMHHNAH
jgi:hypothetical protein